jgi:hypothetical protein
MSARLWLGAVAAFGLALCGVALTMDAHAAMSAYLAAAFTIAAIPMGALAVLLVTYLVRGAWTEDLHAPLLAAARTLPAAGLLFLPIFALLSHLYPWAAHGEAAGFRSVYLTPWFFVLRSGAYFAALSAIVLWAGRAWGDTGRMVRAASVGLIVYAILGSLSGIDWIESLTPDFHSSAFGLMALAFQMLAGFAFAVAVLLARAKPGSTHRYGALMLSMLLTWAYLHAMQFIIVWAGNIPEEVSWYIARSRGPWAAILWTLALLQFVVPFFALLSSSIRNGRTAVLVIALATLALRYLEALWLVLPATHAQGTALWLSLPGAAMAVAGLWLLAFEAAWSRIDSEATRREGASA